MANYKWPNVYPTIKDLSGVVATNSVTSCAYVGEAEFGPINQPTFLSTLKDYTNVFGALNSAKYGYAGYSLAVASESINSHYFVRVVQAGSPEDKEEDRKTNAKYGSVSIPQKDNKDAEVETNGWYVEEIKSVVDKEDASGLFENDDTHALMFVASNPNNLKVAVRLTDSTINENRAYSFSSLSYAPANGLESNNFLATIKGVDSHVIDGLEEGDCIEISLPKATTKVKRNQSGVYTVESIHIPDESESGEVESEDVPSISFIYTAQKDEEGNFETPEDLTAGKVSKFPDASERTVQVEVLQTIGRITTVVETYQFCTLYQAKDNYGNSMYIEDVINGSSDYVMVYVNPNLLKALTEGEVLEVEVSGEINFLEGGQSGGKPTQKELNDAWDLFKDRTQTSVSLLMNSGYVTSEDVSYQNKMIEVAEYRRDCFCLLDIPMTEVEYEDAIDWRKNTLGSTSYRAAVSAPWVRTYDSVQGRANFVMCPSAFLAKLMGAAGDPWHAPAGPNRGIISSSTVSPTGLTQMYDPEVGGMLYADNQINCIIRDAVAGYVNWGQRTLQAKPSALDRINVARTVIYIETILRDAARWHLFENNTPYERMQITLQFSSFLDSILAADGIAAYQVICDNSNNTPLVIQNNQLVIDIILTPVYAAESIILNTTITGADASVTVTSTAN